MKQIIFTLTFIMSLGVVPMLANNSTVIDKEFNSKKCEYTPILVRDLPKYVQETLAMGFADFCVVSAEVETKNNASAIYKVVLLDPENIEFTVVISSRGEIVE